MANYIIVPEGLEIDKHNKVKNCPSYIFREVLKTVARISKKDDKIYICPANNFGGAFSEQEVGSMYLKMLGVQGKIISFDPQVIGYIDTFGNARYLREYIKRHNNWQKESFTLIVYKTHSVRSALIFKKIGFQIEDVRKVKVKQKRGRIVKRLSYYNFPLIHFFYEYLCIVKFYFDYYFFKTLR